VGKTQGAQVLIIRSGKRDLFDRFAFLAHLVPEAKLSQISRTGNPLFFIREISEIRGCISMVAAPRSAPSASARAMAIDSSSISVELEQGQAYFAAQTQLIIPKAERKA
jgi:hypothetical protein